MKKFNFLLLAIVAVLFTSCATFNPNVSGQQSSVTKVNLSSANFRKVGFVQGSSSATYILGIGGLTKKGLVASSKAKMYENTELKGAQCVINEHTEWKASNINPYMWGTVSVTTSGTVIEFNNNAE